MSVKPDNVTKQAKQFSLNDYMGAVKRQAPAQQLTFEWNTAQAVEAKSASACPIKLPQSTELPQLSFSLPNMRPNNQKVPITDFVRPDEKRLLSAGLVSGGGGDKAETVRLAALLEDAKIKYSKLAAKLASVESSVVKGNKALTTERLAARAKEAQLIEEIRVGRETEAKLRRELLCSPATTAAQAEASRFKLAAEGAVKLEAEHALSTKTIEQLHSQLKEKEYELSSTRSSLQAVTLDHERVCSQLGQLQAEQVGVFKSEAAAVDVVDVSVHEQERALMQARIDELEACNAAINKQIADVAAANDDKNPAVCDDRQLESTTQQHLERQTLLEQKRADLQLELDTTMKDNVALQKRISELVKTNEEMDLAVSQGKELASTTQTNLEEAEQRVATVQKEAEARVDAANQRFEALYATLPSAAQEELNLYSQLLARAKMLAAKSTESADASVVAAVAEQEARDAFEKLSCGTATRHTRYFTRARSTRRMSCGKPNISLKPQTRVGLSATSMSGTSDTMLTANTTGTDTDALELNGGINIEEQIAAMPKVDMKDRVQRAVSTIKVDLVTALHMCQDFYKHEVEGSTSTASNI